MIGKSFKICPDSPNCVSSMANPKDAIHFIEPLSYTGSRKAAQEQLLSALEASTEETHKLLKAERAYWHYEFRTPWLKLRDNVEFFFPEKQKVIHMRSASEVGYSDMGTNRKRLEKLRKAFLARS